MKFKTLLLILVFSSLSCDNSEKSDDNNNDFSKCLQTIIDGILEEPMSNPKRFINSYNYLGEKVFEISPKSNVSEPATNVIDVDCVTICLIGGIDGNQNDCENFENAEFIERVWTDPR
jgi:hypothetical protein